MLKIRLQRVGRKHEPAFRIVVTDSLNSTKSGKFKEIVGSYDPRQSRDVIDAERVKYWLSQGAIATGSVHNLLVTHKIIDDKKINVLPKKTFTPKEEAPETTDSPAESENSDTESTPDSSTEDKAEETPEAQEASDDKPAEPAPEESGEDKPKEEASTEATA